MVQPDYRTHSMALPHQVDSSDPIKKVLLGETMDPVAVAKSRPASPVMLNPVTSSVLEFQRDALVYAIRVDILHKCAR